MTLRLKLFVLIAGVIIFAMSGVTAVALWRELVRGQELLQREGVALAGQTIPLKRLLGLLKGDGDTR